MEIVIQVGGGTLGHPNGANAGAKAVCQAIDAYKQGISLKQYAEKHIELIEALNKWGTARPVWFKKISQLLIIMIPIFSGGCGLNGRKVFTPIDRYCRVHDTDSGKIEHIFCYEKEIPT